MTIMKLHEPVIQPIERVVLVSLFLPLVSSVAIMIALCILVVKRPDNIKWLALKLAAEKFEEVLLEKTESDERTGSISHENQRHLSYETRLRVQRDLIKSVHQKLFYILYLSCSVPLQFAIIMILGSQKLLTEQLYSETCTHYLNYFSMQTTYYSCSVKDRIPHQPTNVSHYDTGNITSFCLFRNQTNDADFEDVICRAYLFDITGIFDVLANIYVWHKLLSLFSILLIRWNFIMTRKIRNECLYIFLATLCPIIIPYFALMLYAILSNKDSIPTLIIIWAVIGLTIVTAISMGLSINIYKIAHRSGDVARPNFTETHLVVRNQKSETTSLLDPLNGQH
jgi:hypothetical protein